MISKLQAAAAALWIVAAGLAPLPSQARQPGPGTTAHITYWSEAALSANARDHALPPPGTAIAYSDQFGPTRTSRAFAIIHLAMFDALNAIRQRYPSYTGIGPAPYDSLPDAALAKAARDTLVALYPSQSLPIDQAYQADIGRMPAGRSRNNGVETGRRAAAAILALRAADGMYSREPLVGMDFQASIQPGRWRPDPVSRLPYALGAWWERVRPFVIPETEHFKPGPPPALGSSAYAAAFNEVKLLGGDSSTTPTRRTPAQTVAGIYWAYDSTPYLGSPPRVFNQVAHVIAAQRGVRDLDLARMLALLNVAMADATIVVWDAKYDYQLWRPVTGVREAGPGTSPTGLGDGNRDTQADAGWTPLGAPASNTRNPNFTPPFPAYPSGHAGLAGAAFQALRNFYGTDQIAFTFVSDEFNGITRDNRGNVRPRIPRSFTSLSQAEWDVGRSRVYLGVHWPFDHTSGTACGRHVANYLNAVGLVQPNR